MCDEWKESEREQPWVTDDDFIDDWKLCNWTSSP